ncbi:hypothetical protein D0A34_00625 [Microcoleus vaginatus PCC 9802]|nr:hypothetical protein MicvaDRAFT_0111 [Microcoleus vaginatus FGP-2]UNU17552.1 hypothetical protein D0A34_00625 [Microcoleus vaginatus PCC 9802]
MESALGYRSGEGQAKALVCIGSKKIKNIFTKRLTTLGRVDTLIKRQKRSGSLNRGLKAKKQDKKLNLEKRIV